MRVLLDFAVLTCSGWLLLYFVVSLVWLVELIVR